MQCCLGGGHGCLHRVVSNASKRDFEGWGWGWGEGGRRKEGRYRVRDGAEYILLQYGRTYTPTLHEGGKDRKVEREIANMIISPPVTQSRYTSPGPSSPPQWAI